MSNFPTPGHSAPGHQSHPSIPSKPGQPQPIHAPVNPDPKAHPIHPAIPTQPIHEGGGPSGGDPSTPVTETDRVR